MIKKFIGIFIMTLMITSAANQLLNNLDNNKNIVKASKIMNIKNEPSLINNLENKNKFIENNIFKFMLSIYFKKIILYYMQF